MKDQNNLKQNLIEVILNSWGKYCSMCGTKRQETNIQVVYAYADGALIHMDCSSCDKQFVLNVVGMGFQMAPLMTDLGSNEIEKFTNSRNVNSDDLIELHKVLFENSNADNLIEKFHLDHHNSKSNRNSNTRLS